MTHQQQVADRLAQLRREKSAREKRDLDQKELADVIGVTPETYSRYENAKRRVPDEAILALAEFYGVSPAFIRYGIRDTIRIAGLEIDLATIERVSEQELADWRRLLEVAETRKEAPPPTRRAGNSDRRRK